MKRQDEEDEDEDDHSVDADEARWRNKAAPGVATARRRSWADEN
jgi:hypothetical protein